MIAWNKDLLSLLELVSIAFAGAAGIIGILAETRDKKEAGKLNAKGKFTILCLLIGTIFSIWFKSISKSIEQRENLAKQIKEDSIQNRRSQEYVAFQKKQDDLLYRQNLSLNSIQSLSDQQSQNYISQKEVLSTAKIIAYPLKNLQFSIFYQTELPDVGIFPEITHEDLRNLRKAIVDLNKEDYSIFKFLSGTYLENFGISDVDECEINGKKLVSILGSTKNTNALLIYDFLKKSVFKAVEIEFYDSNKNEIAKFNYDFIKNGIVDFTVRLDFKEQKSYCWITGSNAEITPSQGVPNKAKLTMDKLDNSQAKVFLGDYVGGGLHFFSEKAILQKKIKVKKLSIENVNTNRVVVAKDFNSFNVSNCVLN